jgi:hypothetical protein
MPLYPLRMHSGESLKIREKTRQATRIKRNLGNGKCAYYYALILRKYTTSFFLIKTRKTIMYTFGITFLSLAHSSLTGGNDTLFSFVIQIRNYVHTYVLYHYIFFFIQTVEAQNI